MRTIDDAVPGLGVLAVSPRTVGAGEIITIAKVIGATSGSINEIVDGQSSIAYRIVSVSIAAAGLDTDPGRIGVYFGTGAAYLTNPASAIASFDIGGVSGQAEKTWPDGAGPVSADNEDISWITENEVTALMEITIQYREE